jgi:hypothetical protein
VNALIGFLAVIFGLLVVFALGAAMVGVAVSGSYMYQGYSLRESFHRFVQESLDEPITVLLAFLGIGIVTAVVSVLGYMLCSAVGAAIVG